MQSSEWYHVKQEAALDSPSVLIYKSHLEHNLDAMLQLVENPAHLMPHIKTNKMAAVVRLMRERGVEQVKVSTIAEAELAAREGIPAVLIAHQLVGPKLVRLGELVLNYPAVTFSVIADNELTVKVLDMLTGRLGVVLPVFVDINSGMNRTGCEPSKLPALVAAFQGKKHIQLAGWHIYDGHHRQADFDTRKKAISTEFQQALAVIETLALPPLPVIAGGTPAFTTHATGPHICSPGTSVFWDWGYGDTLTEQPFKYAALILTRVISKPADGLVTIDMGHKAVAAENPIDKRIRFLNVSDYELISQSEEHGVLKVSHWDSWHIGQVLYGVPYHVCPTINLYDEAYVIDNRQWVDIWAIEGRRRRLTV